MAELDTFTIFLVLGLAMIIVGILVFSSAETSFIGGILPGSQRTVVSSSVDESFSVGPENVETALPYRISFNVSNLRAPAVHALEDGRIFSGVLFGSGSMKYTLDTNVPQFMTINFTVTKTNSYAPLIIKINGKEAMRKLLSAGDYSFNIDKELLSDTMEIEIGAEGSGWKIWAPAVYDLSSVRITVDTFNERSYIYKFDLSGKYDTFKRGRIVLNFIENRGSLSVPLNGVEIFDEPPANSQNIEFYKDRVRNGVNSLEFRASEGSSFLANGAMTIAYVTTQENKLVQPFNVSNSTYRSFKSGELRFEVTGVSKDGGIGVLIMNGMGTTFSRFETVSPGEYRYAFNATNIAMGKNDLVIESAGGAVFSVRNVRITV
ncbi:MAG: hypothetical protein HY364_05325 [Candidatus Aenigmarchaeota archaeon]|nr:hypothetical protein [Candidatus Aenigmarchaeota archaeon]